MHKKFLLSLMGFFIISIILTGCSSAKDAISGEDFTNSLKKHGYIITDESDKYEEFTTSYINGNDADTETVFLFVDFKEEANATSFFESMHSQLHGVEHNSKDADNVEDRIANYQYQELTADDYFYRIIKVEDTILYLQTPSENKSEAMAIVDELGY